MSDDLIERRLAGVALEYELPGEVDRLIGDAATRIEQDTATIAALRAELEGVRKDAERYRWLRDRSAGYDGIGDPDNGARLWYWAGRREVFCVGADLDEVTDVAMAEDAAASAAKGE